VKYAGPGNRAPLAFNYYNADEVVAGAPMKEWLRFSVSMRHAAFGEGTNNVEAAKRRVDAAFEFATKLGLEWYTFRDGDVAPLLADGTTTAASEAASLREVAAHMAARQAEMGVQCLWGAADLTSHPRYAAGAATSPDASVFARAAGAVKAAMEATAALDGANFVFDGGAEGYGSLLNTNLRRELDHYARFLHMAVAHKQVRRCVWVELGQVAVG